MINVEEIKDKIILFLQEKGPSLPLQVSRAMGIEQVLASAILSELLGQKRIVLSHLRIGSSPLYLIPGQEQKLENFDSEIKGVEKEAYLKLKENKLLIDEEQQPAIRVALRSIKDFASSFKYKEKIFWRYAFSSEGEINELLDNLDKNEAQEKKLKEKQEKEIQQIKDVMEKPIEPVKEKRIIKQKIPFIEKIKKTLEKKNIEIIKIEKQGKKEIFLRVKESGKEFLLLALDKKKIDYSDLLKANKKSQNPKLPYKILAIGIPKKMKETIEALKNLDNIEIMEGNKELA